MRLCAVAARFEIKTIQSGERYTEQLAGAGLEANMRVDLSLRKERGKSMNEPPRVQNFVTRMLKNCTMFLRSVQPSTESVRVRNSLRTAGPMSKTLCITTVQTALGVAVRWLDVTDLSTREGRIRRQERDRR